jgi:hypothetical protein
MEESASQSLSQMEDTLASFPASSPPESQPEPDTSAAASEPAPEMEKLAERNRVLTKKLKEAVQARMAAKAAKQAKEEHRKQAQIESDLRRKLAEQIDREKEKIRRDKEAHEQKAKNAAWNKVVGKHHLSPAVQAGAKAIALKKGRKLPILADFNEFHRVGRLRPDDLRPDDHPRTSPVTSTSLQPCTPSSSGPACP